MRQPRKPQPQMVSEPNLQPGEAALLERFRRLKDGQKGFVSRTIDLLLSNQSARSNQRADHAFLAVWWRVKDSRRVPIKEIENCKAVWENPKGMRFDIADPSTNQIFSPEGYEDN